MNKQSAIRSKLKAFRAKIRKLTQPKSAGNKKEDFPGLPENIQWARANQICIEHFHSPLQDARYTHLSAWKSSGAYRLFLKLDSGKEVTLIFKDSVYNEESIPALVGLPIRPGPPEYAVFRSTHDAMSHLAPKAYLAEELISRRHYQYLLQDLYHDYFPLRGEDGIIDIAKRLPYIHEALSSWATANQPAYLLDFRQGFLDKLLLYTEKRLGEYNRGNPSDKITRTLSLLDRFQALYNQRICGPASPYTTIHGDLNYTNIFLNKANPSDFKVIDWEWTGTGIPHADLVSLLKGSTPELEMEALRQYSLENKQFDEKEHQCLYLWSKIERGLLDASFLSTQAMGSDHQTNFSLHSAVSSSLNRVLSAYQILVT